MSLFDKYDDAPEWIQTEIESAWVRIERLEKENKELRSKLEQIRLLTKQVEPDGWEGDLTNQL